MLTDIVIRKAKPKTRPYKLSDSNGLHLLVTEKSKLWRYAYRFGGKQKTLAIGAYPVVSLNDARAKHIEAKRQLLDGIDPSSAKIAAKQTTHAISANSFEVIAREWHQIHMTIKTTGHAKKVLDRLENDVFQSIGHITIKDIEAPDVLAVLRKIEQRGALDLAHMTKQIIGQVFRYAIATGKAIRNPVPDLEGALKPKTVTHYAAITEPFGIAELLRATENYTGGIVTKCALMLSFHSMLRPVEIRTAEWCEIDLDRKEWRIPAAKMKKRLDHIVPLSRQVVEIFEQLKPITGHRRFVFPSVRTSNAPMSESTINGALKRLGFGDTMTAHGFRSMASTRLNESNLFSCDVIERQLAHNDRNAVRAAYNRAQYLPERIKMMQWWSNYLDSLRENSNIVMFQQAKS
jgi:integrase